jgi:hydroxymethylpyrimidine/phosphomethylpyrimidine kinase
LRPIVLSIAGSDPASGAGIQADLKAIEASGGYAATAITAITVQNTTGVRRSRALEADLVRDQLEALFEDLDIAAVKSGMLGSAPTVAIVAEVLRAHGPLPYVLDPVVASSNGFALLDDPAIETLKRRLIPRATLLTPNVEDVRALSGLEIRDVAEAERAGRRLLDLGCGAVLVKGGHLQEPQATDVLVEAGGTRIFAAPRIETPHTHGTGCVYSAALATWLGRGLAVADAVPRAKEFLTRSLSCGLALGRGHGPTDPLFALHEHARQVPGS